ncbi:uncharacterized protein PRCAT00002638001 [Priceomyces carsonii]|uniref:uncharacterized protein n=1 Tax=Priceomyces carsonii TaxID=28549 RepID=UPI002EDB26EA|nr:unnamed protein product [Priceomyces carsonii]
MSSRAAYLSRYLSSSDDKPKKGKKGKNERNATTTERSNIVIKNDQCLSNNVGSDEEYGEDEDVTEQAPMKIEMNGKRSFKGFKRIDGQNNSDKAIAEPLSNQMAPETIYRDLMGRKIDLDARRKEIENEKQHEKRNERLREQENRAINQSEISRLENERVERRLKDTKTFHVSKDDEEYVNLMKSKARIDDPAVAFSGEPQQSSNISLTGKYYYSKGLNLPNRFGVKAGYLWDGIDRSNGFEALILQKREDMKYKDMTSKTTESYDNDIDYL